MDEIETCDACYRQEAADNMIGVRFHSRYEYDLLLTKEDGWYQFDTDQDAWYFGAWVNVLEMRIFTYAEGDRILEVFASIETFKKRLDDMAEFHGDPPPMASAITWPGKRIDFYDVRPSSSNVEELQSACRKALAEAFDKASCAEANSLSDTSSL